MRQRLIGSAGFKRKNNNMDFLLKDITYLHWKKQVKFLKWFTEIEQLVNLHFFSNFAKV